MTHNREAFLNAYIEAALWSTGDGDLESLEAFEIAEETKAEMAKDCLNFLEDNKALLDGLDVKQCGHDFWLTRNGHGCGFYDGDYPEPKATLLTEASDKFGECSLYLGDDDLVYII